METRYEAHYFVDDLSQPFSRQRSNDPMHLIAQATLFIENDYHDAYCEVWDVLKKTLVSKLKRTHSD